MVKDAKKIQKAASDAGINENKAAGDVSNCQFTHAML